jgi:hypothetical protein
LTTRLQMMSLPETKSRNRTVRAVDAFNQYTVVRVPGFEPASLVWGDPEAERAHREVAFRHFAYTVQNGDIAVYVSRDIGQLPDRFLYGIMAHEFGHLLAGHEWNNWTEAGADEAAYEYLDLVINYGSDLDLQYLTCQEVHEVKSSLPSEDFRP